MLTFEIPYKPENAIWHIDGLADGSLKFDSRLKAVAFAIDLARSLRRNDERACVSIEGADGCWRRFNDQMVPLD